MLPMSLGSHRQEMFFVTPVDMLAVEVMFFVTPVDMLAVEVTNIQTGVWERRDGRWCESRAWNLVDVNYLVSCHVCAQPLSL